MWKLTFGEGGIFTLVTCLSIKREYSDHLSNPPLVMRTNAQCPLESFRLPWLEIHSYLTKASCFILLLMLQLFLYWSPVGQKNGKHSDHPSELPYESKCSVPSVKFSDALVKNSFIFDKSFKHSHSFDAMATFILVTCWSEKQEI